MEGIDVYRAWRDGEYYEGLSADQRAQVPGGPVGQVELSDLDMNAPGGLLSLDTHQSWCYNSACLTRCSCLC